MIVDPPCDRITSYVMKYGPKGLEKAQIQDVNLAGDSLRSRIEHRALCMSGGAAASEQPGARTQVMRMVAIGGGFLGVVAISTILQLCLTSLFSKMKKNGN